MRAWDYVPGPYSFEYRTVNCLIMRIPAGLVNFSINIILTTRINTYLQILCLLGYDMIDDQLKRLLYAVAKKNTKPCRCNSQA